MFALLFVGAEKIGLTRVLAPAPDVPPKPVTLEEELAARGISTVPLKQVRLYQTTYMRDQQASGVAGSRAGWTPYTPKVYGRLYGDIPSDAGETIKRAETIPDSRIVVERFYEDPFVFIVRNKNDRHEEACIAFWDAPGFKVK